MFAAGKTSGGGGAPAATVDAQFNYVTMLLHGDGTNGAQNNTFLDSSTNNFTITRNGNTTQGSFSPYGSNWSNFFNGTDALFTFPNSSNFAFGTGSFTIEFWINGPLNNDKFILGGRGAVTVMHITTGGSSSTAGVLRYVGTSTIVSSNVITDNTWHHCAIVRNGSSNITLYVDGVSVGTGTDTGNYTTASGTWIVGQNDLAPSNYLDGYLSNLRIVTGTAVYTGNFTPSTTPLTAITNTSLLTCQSNQFIDNSATPVTITPTSASVQRFNPFGTATAYSTSVIGGSGYFDGSGDYLSLASNAAFGFGTGDFTVEFWLYVNSFTTYQTVVATRAGGSVTDLWTIGFDSGGSTYLYSNTFYGQTAAGVIKIGSWIHVAIVRYSSTIKTYVNGTQSGSSSSNSQNFITAPLGVGANTDASETMNGYISNLRIVKGTAVYTANFTPPTAPVTAISGTSLLTNFTNGAIFDNAMMNNLETVGNAQISTSVYKYGTGSLAFDGNGDYLYVPNFVTNQLRTADYTIEYWIYATSWSNSPVILEYGRGVSGGFGLEFYISTTGGKLDVYGGASTATLLASYSSLSTGAWIHVALTRASGTTRLFINGTQSGSSVTDNTDYTSAIVTLGAYYNGTLGLNGYIDDFRITKYARYTANFTAPTAAFPNTGPV